MITSIPDSTPSGPFCKILTHILSQIYDNFLLFHPRDHIKHTAAEHPLTKGGRTTWASSLNPAPCARD